MASQTLPSPRPDRSPNDLEERRARSLAELGLLDTPSAPEFDGIAALAAHVCGTPTAMVNLLDRERQWCKAAVGSDLKDIPRGISFCTHTTALAVGDLLVVEDARLDTRFANNVLVVGAPFIRFYAGAPIRDALGIVLGAVCVIGPEPRTIDGKQRELLQVLAGQVEALMQERLRARAALRERKLHELVSERLHEAVILFDRQERIFRWNRAAETLYGFRAEEVIGQHASIIASSDEVGQNTAAAIRAALAREGSYEGPHRLRDRSGAPVDVELTVQSINDPIGGRFLFSAHRKARVPTPSPPSRDDEHLFHANRMATYGSLAAGVGHELSNVGQVLQLGVDKLTRDAERRRPLEPSDLETFEFVAARLRTQAQHLLSAGRVPTEATEAFDPSDVVRSVLAKLRETGRTKHLRVETDLPQQRTIIFQDRGALEQVVMNLVTNAADAIAGIGAKPKGSKICVRLHVDEEGSAELAVEDDGPGMSEELQASIFDPYFTTKPASRGNGLGLPVVARLVARTFCGKLQLTSTPDAGTTVTLTIPAPTADSAAA